MDTAGESPSTLEAYGIGNGPTDNFGRQCLLARRFAEAGVRFIELGHPGWDQHGQLRARLTANCTAIDQPTVPVGECGTSDGSTGAQPNCTLCSSPRHVRQQSMKPGSPTRLPSRHVTFGSQNSP